MDRPDETTATGDTAPCQCLNDESPESLADHHEIVEHLCQLRKSPLPRFEVDMATRFVF